MHAWRDDLIYYLEREQECRELAQKARDPAVQLTHHRFAEAYARRARSMNAQAA